MHCRRCGGKGHKSLLRPNMKTWIVTHWWHKTYRCRFYSLALAEQYCRALALNGTPYTLVAEQPV